MWCLRVEHPFPRLYHAIDRFSEDIDITFEEHLGEAEERKSNISYYNQLAKI